METKELKQNLHQSFIISYLVYCIVKFRLLLQIIPWVLVLTIFNEGAYLTFKSIFHKEFYNLF